MTFCIRNVLKYLPRLFTNATLMIITRGQNDELRIYEGLALGFGSDDGLINKYLRVRLYGCHGYRLLWSSMSEGFDQSTGNPGSGLIAFAHQLPGAANYAEGDHCRRGATTLLAAIALQIIAG